MEEYGDEYEQTNSEVNQKSSRNRNPIEESMNKQPTHRGVGSGRPHERLWMGLRTEVEMRCNRVFKELNYQISREQQGHCSED